MKRIPRRTPGGSRWVVTLLIAVVTAIMPAPLIAQHGHGGAHRGGHARAVSHGRGGHVVRSGRARAVRHVGGRRHGIVGAHNRRLALGHDHHALVHHEALFVHHGLHVGLVIAAPFYAVGYPYYVRYRPYRARYRMAATVTQGRADFELHVEEINDGIVRLSWPGDRRAITEVGLFLADSEQQVLAVQTVRAAPFTAVFDIVASMAYAGMTVVYDDGRTVTILVPYAP